MKRQDIPELTLAAARASAWSKQTPNNMNTTETDEHPAQPRLPIMHTLKCWPEFYKEVAEDRKPFEVREHDRDFRAGDCVLLREFNPRTGEYTGAELRRSILCVLEGGQSGIKQGYCVLGIARMTQPTDIRELQVEITTPQAEVELRERLTHTEALLMEAGEKNQKLTEQVERLQNVLSLHEKPAREEGISAKPHNEVMAALAGEMRREDLKQTLCWIVLHNVVGSAMLEHQQGWRFSLDVRDHRWDGDHVGVYLEVNAYRNASAGAYMRPVRNPQGVPIDQVPGGWRFLWEDRGDGKPERAEGRRCRVWYVGDNAWSQNDDYLGVGRGLTYIVQDSDPLPKHPQPVSELVTGQGLNKVFNEGQQIWNRLADFLNRRHETRLREALDEKVAIIAKQNHEMLALRTRLERLEREDTGVRMLAAEERLKRAREALVKGGWFTEEQVGDDIAPRIIEICSNGRLLPASMKCVTLCVFYTGKDTGKVQRSTWHQRIVPVWLPDFVNVYNPQTDKPAPFFALPLSKHKPVQDLDIDCGDHGAMSMFGALCYNRLMMEAFRRVTERPPTPPAPVRKKALTPVEPAEDDEPPSDDVE